MLSHQQTLAGIHPSRCTLPSSPCLQLRLKGGIGRKRQLLQAPRSAAVEQVLTDACNKYRAGDRMTALALFERALKEDADQSQVQRAFYGAMAVHASFGDVELAQMMLRDGISAGLDYEAALRDPSLPEIQSSQQILIQLGRFNAELLKQRAAGKQRPPKPASRSAPSSTVSVDADLSSILGSAKSDEAEVDTSVGAIVKRVAALLVIGIGLGVGLFYLGLEYMFPKF